MVLAAVHGDARPDLAVSWPMRSASADGSCGRRAGLPAKTPVNAAEATT